MPHMVSSEGSRRADVWSAEASLSCEEEDVAAAVEGVDADVCELFEESMDAVAIDNRERTRSNGYVVQTEVMPASAPLVNRVGVSNCLFPLEVNHFLSCSYVVNWTAL